MKAESIVYAIAGMCFGIILGWIIATQQQPARAVAPVAQAAGGTQQQQQSHPSYHPLHHVCVYIEMSLRLELLRNPLPTHVFKGIRRKPLQLLNLQLI